jgi:peptide/nickel transport system substrate-binding protein
MAQVSRTGRQHPGARRLSRRALVRSAAVVAPGAALFAAACGGDSNDEPSGQSTGATTGTAAGGAAAPAVKRGGTLVLAEGNLRDILDPHTSLSDAARVWLAIGDVAIRADGPKWELSPSLVQQWEIPGDGSELVLKLRPGVKFHNRPPTNGRELTGEDIAFNIMRISGKLDPQNAARYQRASNLLALNRAEAVDKSTVRVTLDQPNSAFLRGLSDWRNNIIAKEQPDAGFEEPAKFVGTGPFTIERWENNGQRAEFKRNPQYWSTDTAGGAQPYMDSMRWQWLPDSASVKAAFISKQIDWGAAATPADRADTQSAFKDAVLHTWPGSNWERLAFNTSRKPFDDPRVRTAIALAIDAKAIMDAFRGDGFWDYTGPLASAFPEALPSATVATMPGWNPTSKQQDIAQAKSLMTAAGYPTGNIAFKILTTMREGSWVEHAIRAKDQLEKVWPAIQVEVELPADFATYSRRQVQSDFDVTSSNIVAQPDPVLELTAQYHSKGSRNYMKLSDAEVDQKLDAALKEIDTAKRAAILQEVQRRLIQLMPNVYFGLLRGTAFVNPRIKGLAEQLGPGTGFPNISTAGRAWIDS